jgi:hypothetical protein
MKKLLTLFIALCLTAVMTVPTFAATTYQVSLNTIDGIVGGNSSYAKDAVDKLASQQTEFNRATNKISQNTILINSYQSQKLANLAQIAKLKEAEDPDQDAISALQDANDDLDSKIKACQAEISSSNSQRNELAFQMNQTAMSNNISLIQQGETAKEQYIKYLDSLNAKDQLLLNIQKQQKKVSIAKLKYKRGIISKSALQTEKDALEDLNGQINDSDDQIQSDYSALISALGVADDSTLTVSKLSGEDKSAFIAASNYNYDADLQSVLANSIELRKSQLQVAHDQSLYYSATDEDSRTAAADTYAQSQKEYNALVVKTTKAFASQYKSLQRSVASIQKYDRKTARAKSAMTKAKKKYNYGLISRNEYLTSVDAYNTAISDGNKAITSLFPEILKYQMTVKGY